MARCEECSSDSSCNKCNVPFVYQNKTCGCLDGSFIDGAVCSTCPEKCTKCSSLNHCTDCVNTYSVSEGVCGQGPSIGFFLAIVGAVGGLMLAIIAFNAYSVVKKKAGKSLLEDEGGD